MNGKGVSAVVGVILMVAITVAISATVYWFVSTTMDEQASVYDLNHDGIVDKADATIFEQSYGQTGNPGWIPADFNKDGIVNYLDASLLVSHMSKSPK